MLALIFVVPGRSNLNTSETESNQVLEKSIEVEFRAVFLEAGYQKMRATKGDEIYFSQLHWDSPLEGNVLTRIWGVPSLIQFHLTEDRKNFTSLVFNPKPGSPNTPWEMWRHRHAFLLVSGDRYYWNSLEDEKPVMEREKGLFFDRYLKELWSFWTLQTLSKRMEQNNEPLLDNSYENEEFSTLRKKVQIQYDKMGLRNPIDMSFQINLWHMPVKIYFELKSSTQPINGSQSEYVANNIRWTYNRAEWRRRHGYFIDVWGDYRFETGWPEKKSLSTTEGQYLDELLDHCVSYWVEVSIQQVMSDLERKVQLALREG
jgi:hypothetical protein